MLKALDNRSYLLQQAAKYGDAAFIRLTPTPLRNIALLAFLMGAATILLWLVRPQYAIENSLYVFIHNVTEGSYSVIALIVFVIGWHMFSKNPTANIVILSCFFMAAGLINFAHTLSYPGMPDMITPSSPQKAIFFALSEQMLRSLGLLSIVIVPWKLLQRTRIRYAFLTLSILIIFLVFWIGLYQIQLLPNTFVQGQGLTAFKIAADLTGSVIPVLTVIILLIKSRKPQSFNTSNLIAALLFMMLSQLSFMLYTQVTDLFNLLGHLYKLVGIFFIYKAVIVENIQEPFRQLQASEQSLRKSKEWFSTTLTSIYDAVITTDARAQITFMNPMAEKLTGWSLSNAIGQDIRQVFQLKEENPVTQAITKGVISGLLTDVELHTSTQGKIPIDFSASPIKDDAGKGAGVVLVFRDISERKEAENLQQRLSAILEATTDFVATADKNGRALYYNSAARKILGLKENEDISAITIKDTHPDWANQLVLKEGLPTAAKRGVWEGETAFLSRDGKETPASQVIIAHKGADKNIEFFSTIARDITDFKKAEESQRIAANVVRNIPDGIIITNGKRGILTVNPSFINITGLPEEAIIGRELDSFFTEHLGASFIGDIWGQIEQSGLWQEEVSIQSSKKEMMIELTINSVADAEGRVMHYVAMCRDITVRKKTTDLLQKSSRLSVVGQLAAGIAHEIRNPLTSIKGFIQLLQRAESTDPSRKNSLYLEIMSTELERINFIISEFLILAKPQALNVQKQNVSLMLQDVITLLATQSIMNNVEIVTEFESDIPLIECETNQLKQVFINILKNAIDAMPKGGEIKIELGMADEQNVLIRIIDQGEGISPERLHKLGEPFYSTKEKGTGLGLMICHKVVKEHQGQIHISSQLNQGTTVEVVLPLSLTHYAQ